MLLRNKKEGAMLLGKICILYRRRLFLETTEPPGVPSFVEITT